MGARVVLAVTERSLETQAVIALATILTTETISRVPGLSGLPTFNQQQPNLKGFLTGILSESVTLHHWGSRPQHGEG